MDDRSAQDPAQRTERLRLRRWTDADRAPLARIMADPEVMRYRFAPLSREQSDQFIDENEASFDADGRGLWAVERLEDGRLLGWAGLGYSDFGARFCPAVDVGWTLARDVWGLGYATEAGRVALDHAFGPLGLGEVVAHTTASNERSRAVMRRLGMRHDPADDFDGPWYPEGHPRRGFVLYRMTAADWPRS